MCTGACRVVLHQDDNGLRAGSQRHACNNGGLLEAVFSIRSAPRLHNGPIVQGT
jgi:hypothetical protein